ncbi:reverse transcriptase domain-containing protein [Tanacetum coccineum]
MVKKVDDMTINEYMEYEERMKRQYSRNSGSYFPTYSSHYTSSNNTTIKCPRNAYFNPIQPNTKFNYDSEDGYTTDEESVTSKHEALDFAHTDNARSLEDELSSEEDLDKCLKAEMEKHLNECRVVHKNKRISAPEVDLKKSSKDIEDTINNDNFTSNFPYKSSLEELNPRGFLFPFTIDNYNSYVMANIDASNNVMPRSICEYLMLANLEEAYMSVEMDDLTQQETLGTMKNVLVKIDKFEFLCDFVVADMLKILEK